MIVRQRPESQERRNNDCHGDPPAWLFNLNDSRNLVGVGPAVHAAVAAESRRAAIGVAECMVRIKEVQSAARVEERRLVEQGCTDRCRISEEQQTRRTDRLASVASAAVAEQSRTDRAAIAAEQQIAAEAAAAEIRLEERRLTSEGQSWREFILLFKILLSLWGISMTARVFQIRRTGRRGLRHATVGSRFLTLSRLLFLLGIAFLGNRLRITTAARAVFRLRPFVGSIYFYGVAVINGFNSCREALLNSSSKRREPKLEAEVVKPAASLTIASDSIAEEEVATKAPSSGETSDTADDHRHPYCSETANTRTRFSADLDAWGLGDYADILEAKGYDSEVFDMLSADDANEMMHLVGFKPGHRVRVRKMLEHRRSHIS